MFVKFNDRFRVNEPVMAIDWALKWPSAPTVMGTAACKPETGSFVPVPLLSVPKLFEILIRPGSPLIPVFGSNGWPFCSSGKLPNGTSAQQRFAAKGRRPK